MPLGTWESEQDSGEMNGWCFLSFDVPLSRFKMFGVRLKSKSKKRNFITLGSAGTAESRVVMFCEDIPSERSSTDSGWGSRSSGAPSNVHRKKRESMTRPIQPTTTFSTQKIHHMRAPFSGHNVGHSTLCIRDQYGSLPYSITGGGGDYMLVGCYRIFVSSCSWGVAWCHILIEFKTS